MVWYQDNASQMEIDSALKSLTGHTHFQGLLGHLLVERQYFVLVLLVWDLEKSDSRNLFRHFREANDLGLLEYQKLRGNLVSLCCGDCRIIRSTAGVKTETWHTQPSLRSTFLSAVFTLRQITQKPRNSHCRRSLNRRQRQIRD